MSVIVAAYNSDPDHLDRLMASLDAQSMPAPEIQVVFVDDGSTDDTRSRLDTFARTRENIVVRTIPNSGWASRPRNVGIGLARGEYLLFMDHDDELFPRSLERAYVYGRCHSADVVSAKEVRTTGWSWGWEAFTGDLPHAEHHDPNPLIPMTPHKLYRRRFLLNHDVRFPEGRRVLWEDIYFNVLAYGRGARVSVLSQHPFYHWVTTGVNSSKTFDRDAEEYWSNLVTLFDFLHTELAGMPEGPALLDHHLRTRILAFTGPASLHQPMGYYDVAYRYARQVVERYAPAERDAALRSVDRCRIELLRRGDADLQRRLAEQDRGVTAIPIVEAAAWDGPELVLTVSTSLIDGEGAPVRLRRDGDRWYRDLPGDLAQQLSDDALDVTHDLAIATYEVSVKGRTTHSAWPVPGHAVVSCADDGAVTATVTARFDPVAFAAAHDLDDPVWDFAARLTVMGYVSHRGLRGSIAPAAVLGAVAAVSYANADGLYSLDVAAAVRSFPEPHDLSTCGAQVVARPKDDTVHVTVTIPMPDVHYAGDARLDGQVLLGRKRRVAATVTVEDGQAVLRFAGRVRAGRHALRTMFLGRTTGTGLVLSVDGASARVEAAAPAQPT